VGSVALGRAQPAISKSALRTSRIDVSSFRVFMPPILPHDGTLARAGIYT
jgi:hypothetical protein